MPSPETSGQPKILESIDYKKDIDGLHPIIPEDCSLAKISCLYSGWNNRTVKFYNIQNKWEKCCGDRKKQSRWKPVCRIINAKK